MTMMLLEWVITSIFLILTVLVLRAAFGKRVSARLRYALWAVVLVRLLVPVQLFPSPLAGTRFLSESRMEQTVTDWPVTATRPAAASEDDAVLSLGGQAGPSVVLSNVPQAPHAPVLPDAPNSPAAPDLTKLSAWLGWAWLGGSIALALVLAASNLRFALRLRRGRVPLEGTDCPLPVYEAVGLPSPCLFGVARPAVYVTPEAAADPVRLRHVTAHEYTHFRQGDHLWSFLRCVALAAHWWNPLVWVAVKLSRRDGELSCDEGALKRLGDGERLAYGNTLLALVTAKPGPGDLLCFATTMAGEKRSLKERVSRIACAPRRWLWAAVAVVLATALACLCAFGSAEGPDPADTPDLAADLTFSLNEEGTVVRIEGSVDGIELEHTVWFYDSLFNDTSYPLGRLIFDMPLCDNEVVCGLAACWMDESRTTVRVTAAPRAMISSYDPSGSLIFIVDLSEGTLLELEGYIPKLSANDPELVPTEEEALRTARIAAKLLTEAENYYLSQQTGPDNGGHYTAGVNTGDIPAQVRADAEEFVRERFEALRDKGISYGIDGTAGIVDADALPELDDWRIEFLTGPYWSGQTYWELLGVNRHVELWNVVYAYHSATPDKAWNLANGGTWLTGDGWLTPINYGAEYLLYELGEDGSRTLLTTFGEQGEVMSVMFRRHLRIELSRGGVPEDMADAYFVEEHAEFPLSDLGRELDLNGNGVPEHAQVVDFGGGAGQRLELWEGDELVFADEGYYAHAGWNAVFLCTLDGKDYLLRYHPYMGQGWCDYRYELFTLTRDGREKVVQENSVTFDINFGPIHESFDPEAIAVFMDEINGLLSGSVQLINTDPELSDTFHKEGRLYDSLGWLDLWAPVFVRDESVSLLENLRAYKKSMEAEQYAGEPVLFPMNEVEMGVDIRLRYQDRETRFTADWGFSFQPAESVDIQVFDLNGDGKDEIVFPLVWGHGTGAYNENLYVFDAETLEQYDTSGLNGMILSSIVSTGDEDNFYLSFSAPLSGARVTVPKSEAQRKNPDAPTADKIGLGDIVRYTVRDGQVFCRLGCDASGKLINYTGYLDVPVRLTPSGGFSFGRVQYTQTTDVLFE